MSTTFNVNQKALQSMAEKPFNTVSVASAFETKTKSKVEASGANRSNLLSGQGAHSFVDAVHLSYSHHVPLILSPDTVWLTIAQGFANHVNANAESLRKRFVSHEGKKMILIDEPGFVKGSPDNNWQGTFGKFSDKLSEYIGKKRDLVVSNFSTTGLIEKAASEIVLMDSMKSYFKYAVRTSCGIPTIILTGTVEDWQNIRTRVDNLSEYDLGWWTKSLGDTMDHFVKAAQGSPDIKFWDEMYKQSGGSGGPYISGWINTLLPYTEDYKGNLRKNQYAEKWNDKRGWGGGPTMDQYPSSLAKVPFKWEIDGKVHDMEFLGGLVGIHQNVDLSIESVTGWAVRDQGTQREGVINPNEDW
jgi:hypothetical protein